MGHRTVTATSPTLQLTDRVVDLARLMVHHTDGKKTSLTTREAQLLQYLSERAEQDVSRDELLETIWEYKAHYATRAVDVAMRRLRSKIEPDPSHPVHLISVHGVGYRFVPSLAPVPVQAPEQVVSTLDRLTNLAPDHTTFVGREDDLATIASLFRSARLVTVLGPGGIGKTRLAQRFGARVLDQASPTGGVWFCDLTESVGISGILGTVAAALDVPLTGGHTTEDLTEQLGSALAGRGRTLLILDNFEQIVSHAAATVGSWLAAAPDLRVLVATRERLRIPGEATYELPPLGDEEALSLFLDRARSAGAQLDDGAMDAVRQIIRRLDGLPLAIELAAPRTRVLSPEQILERLAKRFELLRGSGRGGQARQATLRSAIDWSWDLLNSWEKDALAQCAIFSGGFTLDAVEEIVDLDHHTTAPWALDIIEALRDKSLLHVYEPPDLPGELRFSMFESIRAYAAERLDETDLRADTEARHAAYYVTLGERLSESADGHGGIQFFSRLTLEMDNILAVHRRRADSDPVQAVRAVLLLEPIFHTRGPYDTHAELVDSAVLIAANRVPELYPRALAIRGTVYGIRGMMGPARRDLETALPLVRGKGGLDEVRVVTAMALIEADQSRVEVATKLCQEAVQICRSDGLARREGVITGMLGALKMMSEDLVEAERLLTRSLEIHEREGNARFKALDLSNLGIILLDLGRVDEAEQMMQRSLRIHREMRNRRRVATALLNLSSVRAEQWRLAEAEELAREALRLYKAVGYPRFSAVCLMSLGTILLALRRPGLATQSFKESVSIANSVGDVITKGLSGAMLGATLAEKDQIPQAERYLQASAAALEPQGYAQGLGINKLAEGFLFLAKARESHQLGDPSAAKAYRDSARTCREEATPPNQVSSGFRFFAILLDKALEREVSLPPKGPW